MWSNDEETLRSLYAALLGVFGTPGTVEVQTASEMRIREEVEVETHNRIDSLMSKAETGPTALAKYLADQAEIRA